MEKQKELLQKDSLVQDESYLQANIAKAREDYEVDPTVPGKINGLVDALLKFEDESYENEAIDVLNKAHADTGAYQNKMRIGDIRIRQMTRQFRKLRAAGQTEQATELARKQLQFEIGEFTERAKNYPTDMSVKYELGKRLFLAGQFDDAIGALQQAQRDPRRYVSAMNYLGQAFMKKQWWQEAIDTFQKVLQKDLSEDRVKDVRYNLGDCHERLEQYSPAQEQFSHVAQIDFNYKDVRKRLEGVRKKAAQSQGA